MNTATETAILHCNAADVAVRTPSFTSRALPLRYPETMAMGMDMIIIRLIGIAKASGT